MKDAKPVNAPAQHRAIRALRQAPLPWRPQRILLSSLLGALAAQTIAALTAGALLYRIPTPVLVLAFAVCAPVVSHLTSARIVALISAGFTLLYLVLALTPAMDVSAPAWVRNDTIQPGVQAVVALSSTLNSEGDLDAPGAERLITALEIMKSERIGLLATTRVTGRFNRAAFSSDSGQARLVDLTPRRFAWRIVDSAKSTRDEAVNSAKLLMPLGVTSIILVTSPLHTRRACTTFEEAGFRVICRAAREIGKSTWHPREPDARVRSAKYLAYEQIASLDYWIRFGIDAWARPSETAVK